MREGWHSLLFLCGIIEISEVWEWKETFSVHKGSTYPIGLLLWPEEARLYGECQGDREREVGLPRGVLGTQGKNSPLTSPPGGCRGKQIAVITATLLPPSSIHHGDWFLLRNWRCFAVKVKCMSKQPSHRGFGKLALLHVLLGKPLNLEASQASCI